MPRVDRGFHLGEGRDCSLMAPLDNGAIYRPFDLPPLTPTFRRDISSHSPFEKIGVEGGTVCFDRPYVSSPRQASQ